MNGKLTLEVFAPDGNYLKRTGVSKVVLRRREKRFDPGSEIAVYPLHGRTLVRLPSAPVRYQIDDCIYRFNVEGGFAEVKDDRVTILTSAFAEVVNS